MLLICFPDEDRGGHCISCQAAVIMQLMLLLWSPSPSQSLGTSCCCAVCYLVFLIILFPPQPLQPVSFADLFPFSCCCFLLSPMSVSQRLVCFVLVFFLQFSVLQNKAALVYHSKCEMDRERLVFHENCFILYGCH